MKTVHKIKHAIVTEISNIQKKYRQHNACSHLWKYKEMGDCLIYIILKFSKTHFSSSVVKEELSVTKATSLKI